MRRPDGTWLIEGSTPFEEVEEALGLDQPGPEEARRTYHTVGGFVLAEFGRLPREGESVDHQGIRFQVVRMEGQRIAKIVATSLANSARVMGGS